MVRYLNNDVFEMDFRTKFATKLYQRIPLDIFLVTKSYQRTPIRYTFSEDYHL